MLQLAIACLVIALIAAVLGFGGIAGSFVVSFFFGGGMRRRSI
jgi:uncharacterized membrane protein YtjA (UPF0391 family)